MWQASETNFEWSLKYSEKGTLPNTATVAALCASVAIHRHADARCLEHRKS